MLKLPLLHFRIARKRVREKEQERFAVGECGFIPQAPLRKNRRFCLKFAPVAQLDRALACGAKGRRFESCQVYQKESPSKEGLSFWLRARFEPTTRDFAQQNTVDRRFARSEARRCLHRALERRLSEASSCQVYQIKSRSKDRLFIYMVESSHE